MLGGDHETARSHCGHSSGDNVAGVTDGGKVLGNDFIPVEEAGVVKWR